MHTTPIYEAYKDYDGIKLIDFGGWDLPVNFKNGIIFEHNAVRNAVGLFDVSHMGECYVEGDNALDYLDSLMTNNIKSITDGQVIYTLMCYPNGTVVDDLLIYRISPVKFFVVMNASNVEKDLAWLMKDNPNAAKAPKITDLSPKKSQLALQGPKAVDLLEKLWAPAKELGAFHFVENAVINGVKCLVSRTGYTGEDGFELYLDNEDGPSMWKLLVEKGAEPCGLGARDSLRMESKLPLYGHEISDSITPLEANLTAFVKLEGRTFVGSEALVKQQNDGVPRSLRGFEMTDGGVARNGYKVFCNGEEIGFVTSGTKSPSLDKLVGYAMMKRDTGLKFGDEIQIDVHGKMKTAKLCRTPFFKRGVRNDEIKK